MYVCMYVVETVLFTGDHLGYSAEKQALDGFKRYNHGNILVQMDSIAMLADDSLPFLWILPGTQPCTYLITALTTHTHTDLVTYIVTYIFINLSIYQPTSLCVSIHGCMAVRSRSHGSLRVAAGEEREHSDSAGAVPERRRDQGHAGHRLSVIAPRTPRTVVHTVMLCSRPACPTIHPLYS
jgi:hypothetical protein